MQLLRDNRLYTEAYQLLQESAARFPEDSDLVYDQAMVAEKLGQVVAKELIHFDEIATMLKDPEQLRALNPIIEQHLDTFLHVKLKEKQTDLTNQINNLKKEIKTEAPQLTPEEIEEFWSRK